MVVYRQTEGQTKRVRKCSQKSANEHPTSLLLTLLTSKHTHTPHTHHTYTHITHTHTYTLTHTHIHTRPHKKQLSKSTVPLKRATVNDTNMDERSS